MDWPAYSPDLNPIEHVWDALGRRTAARLHHPENTQQLKQMLIEEWILLTQEMLHQLVLSMRRRCEATIARRQRAIPPISTSTILPWDWRGGKYSPVPCTRDSIHKTFGPTDLTSTYSMCARRVFGGIGHGAQAFRSGVRCSNHQATHVHIHYSETFVIPLNELQMARQEKLRALNTEKAFTGLFDFNIASKAPSDVVLL
ncbi:transposable element Tc1 transposase [Trichonephila clavipes]|nr:transposable element Tc1 transposase [Trichonephila clavipes]